MNWKKKTHTHVKNTCIQKITQTKIHDLKKYYKQK